MNGVSRVQILNARLKEHQKFWALREIGVTGQLATDTNDNILLKNKKAGGEVE